MSEELIPLQKNIALKRLFANRNLDLAAVMEFTPLQLDLENTRLLALAKFVVDFERLGSREAMEIIAGTWVFPPVFPAISPESDWGRFELWLKGEPVEKRLEELVPDQVPFRKPEDIAENELDAELQRLQAAIEGAGIGICLHDIPPRLLYAYLFETLDDHFEVSGGGWNIDGCSGFCPDCIQRPWCNTGQSGCWTEDEVAGKMYLTPELSPYISASPQSLAILQRLQAEEDANFARFKEGKDWPQGDEDWQADQN